MLRQDLALIEELCARFEKKPRKCRKINDSNIGDAERIVCVSNNTFYYYPKIQQFQDLDFDKLQYVVPKAGVKLDEILQLKFPPRKENERNFFTITLPKNRILKFTKTLKEIIVDEEAQGEQEWCFYFEYDIVALPIRERKVREAQLKEAENKRLRAVELARLKEKEQLEKIQKIKEEITSLNQVEELRNGGGQNEEYQRKRQQLNDQEDIKRRINQTDQLFFHFHYRRLLITENERATSELELKLLQQIGKFRLRAEQTVQEFIDQLSFSPIKFKFGTQYQKNNLKLKFGEKGLNQQFLANYCVSNAIYQLRKDLNLELRVPLKAIIKYKGFKVLVSAITPLDFMNEQAFDDSIIHGHSSDNWKIDFMIVEYLTTIINKLRLKPYFSEVHYQKVQIHLGSNLKILKTKENPYSMIKELDPNSFSEDTRYSIYYFYDIDQVFPIDLQINRNINQQNVRLRPQYILNFVKRNPIIESLSAGSLSYAFEDEEGEKQDINVAKASQMLKLQQIVLFVRLLDNLDIIITNSEQLSAAMKKYGINMRYLGRIIKLTQLPYIRSMAAVEAISRVIRSIYRDHQLDFTTQQFRNNIQFASLIREAFDRRTNPGMRKIRMKQLKQQQEKASKMNAVDFLNLMFGMSVQFQAFWQIIKSKVKEKYQYDMKDAQDYPHGYLLQTVLYHCGIKVRIRDKLKLFTTPTPLFVDDIVGFSCRSKIFDYPSMGLYRLTNLQGIQGTERIVARLQLALQIKRALNQSQAQILLQLSRYSSKVGPPVDKYTLESFFFYLYHPTADNFQTAHRISEAIFPSSHPCIMDLYLQFAKLKDLDPITLKKAAEIHSIRNLGISHWKTSQILANFKENQYINHLIRAEAGVEESHRTELYLAIINQLTKFGKLFQSLEYVKRSIKAFDHLDNLSEQQQQNYFAILLKGLENNYVMRTIYQLIQLAQIFYNALTRYEIPFTSIWFQRLLYYTLKGYLEYNKKKYYLFKLILIFNEEKKNTATPQQKSKLFQELGVRWQQSRNHINHIKQMIIKLQFGYTQINFLPDFFGQFYYHVERLKNQDFNQGLKQFKDLFFIFGFNYYQDALLESVYAFQQRKQKKQ